MDSSSQALDGELVDESEISESGTGELVESAAADQVKRLYACEARIRSSFADMALAVAEIHAGKLYRAKGYDNFVDYCRVELQRQKSEAYRILAAGQVIPLLDSPVGERIHGETVFRPIAKMKPENQAKVINLAVTAASKKGIPVTAHLIADVAEKNFKWVPAARHKRAKARRRGAPNPDVYLAERRLRAITDIGRTPAEFAALAGAKDLAPLLRDVRAWINETARRIIGDE